jgi:hypothetical protein
VDGDSGSLEAVDLEPGAMEEIMKIVGQGLNSHVAPRPEIFPFVTLFAVAQSSVSRQNLVTVTATDSLEVPVSKRSALQTIRARVQQVTNTPPSLCAATHLLLHFNFQYRFLLY